MWSVGKVAMLCTGWGCGEGEEMLCLDVEGVVFLGVAVGGEGDVSGYAFVCGMCCGVVEGFGCVVGVVDVGAEVVLGGGGCGP